MFPVEYVYADWIFGKQEVLQGVQIQNLWQVQVNVLKILEVKLKEDSSEKWAMDETEWRTSFSLAENKLGKSMSPVQRHVIVLQKMIKKFYFPEVISTYSLKNLLFWECKKKGQVFWREDNSGSCLLFMLDRLQECLESRHLPHYIMPQSNLLMYKDPSRLKEAAVQVAEVRCNILSKTFNLLRKLQSLTFQSQTYL